MQNLLSSDHDSDQSPNYNESPWNEIFLYLFVTEKKTREKNRNINNKIQTVTVNTLH